MTNKLLNKLSYIHVLKLFFIIFIQFSGSINKMKKKVETVLFNNSKNLLTPAFTGLTFCCYRKTLNKWISKYVTNQYQLVQINLWKSIN